MFEMSSQVVVRLTASTYLCTTVSLTKNSIEVKNGRECNGKASGYRGPSHSVEQRRESFRYGAELQTSGVLFLNVLII